MKSFQALWSLAIPLTSFHDLLVLPISSSIVLRHVFFGPPLLLYPWGFQSNPVFSIAPVSLRNVRLLQNVPITNTELLTVTKLVTEPHIERWKYDSVTQISFFELCPPSNFYRRVTFRKPPLLPSSGKDATTLMDPLDRTVLRHSAPQISTTVKLCTWE